MTLRARLTAAARHAPEYAGGLSNHLPMALVALDRLGADDARLARFEHRYARRLEPARPDGDVLPPGAWVAHRGDPQAAAALRASFHEWLAFEGPEAVLRVALPVLMPGCGAAAFHGLIRVASALRAGHRPELAEGLAYWAARFLPLSPLPADPGHEGDVEACLRKLPAVRSTERLIAGRLLDAAGHPAVQEATAALAIGDDTLERLARLAARAYAGSGDVTALHLVTGCHAMRVVGEHLDDRHEAWRWFWQAFAAAVASAGLRLRPPAPVQRWPALVRAALDSDDEHAIKLVDSGREEERAYGGDDWRRAASRAVTPVRRARSAGP